MTPVLKSMTKRNILTGIIDRNKSAKNWEIVRDNKMNNNEWSNSKNKINNNLFVWNRFVFKSKRLRRRWSFKIVQRLSLSNTRNNNNNKFNRKRENYWRNKMKFLMWLWWWTAMIGINQRCCKKTSSSLRIFSYSNWR